LRLLSRKILPIDLTEFQGKFICQKSSFLCAAVSVGMNSLKLGRGFFGGEGFIMQKIEGDGLAFVHSGGTLAKKRTKSRRESRYRLHRGFTKDVDCRIHWRNQNSISVEGLFYAIRGPGTVYTIFTFQQTR
jgi:uncharacterized protein (AIM24 family)